MCPVSIPSQTGSAISDRNRLDDMHKASVEASNYLRENPNCQESQVSPFKHKYAHVRRALMRKLILDRWGTSLYEFYDMHPQKAIRFAKAMQGVTRCTSITP